MYLDQTDDNAAWKVDTSAFTIASDASIRGSLSMAADKCKDYGVEFDAQSWDWLMSKTFT